MTDRELWIVLKQSVRSRLMEAGELSETALLKLIERQVFDSDQGAALTLEEKQRLIERIYASFRGLDVLQPLVDDPAVSEIMVNRHDEIFVERSGRTFQIADRFESQERLEDLIQMIVGQVNRTVNESEPIVDARLPDGSRVHVVLPPVALKGPVLTIRKFPEEPLRMDKLVELGSLTEEAAAWLKTLVQAGYNIFVSGGTGSGKTTFLNALSDFIPPDSRIVTIEDAAELQIRNVANLVSLETRNPNSEGKGEINIRSLIRASLRMRPDRIIVGEVRGAEALDMLQAMNTGHDGSLSTGHANSPEDLISRLETMVLGGALLPVEVIRAQIASAIDIIIHLARMPDGRRKVMEICEVAGCLAGQVQMSPLFVSGSDGRLRRSGNALMRRRKLELADLTLPEHTGDESGGGQELGR
ncbi:CpaF family protein [Xylanibacillus composti]|uniref:Type II secretion system protein E n=1 Tax=Xylanibacillus composti TaxID=1572762 RepID=A0A8J4H278_9BACL|nr:CpaF family protein [Xylanibacillus composti]MDT9724232.1 CpaF family protein [Xylanibacillus composti]GIQ68251.1 type II secretion system protein E [Xylanibacillus composti]